MNLPPAVRTFVKNFCEKFKSVSIFCTMGGFGNKRFFSKFDFYVTKNLLFTHRLKKQILFQINM